MKVKEKATLDTVKVKSDRSVYIGLIPIEKSIDPSVLSDDISRDNLFALCDYNCERMYLNMRKDSMNFGNRIHRSLSINNEISTKETTDAVLKVLKSYPSDDTSDINSYTEAIAFNVVNALIRQLVCADNLDLRMYTTEDKIQCLAETIAIAIKVGENLESIPEADYPITAYYLLNSSYLTNMDQLLKQHGLLIFSHSVKLSLIYLKITSAGMTDDFKRALGEIDTYNIVCVEVGSQSLPDVNADPSVTKDIEAYLNAEFNSNVSNQEDKMNSISIPEGVLLN